MIFVSPSAFLLAFTDYPIRCRSGDPRPPPKETRAPRNEAADRAAERTDAFAITDAPPPGPPLFFGVRVSFGGDMGRGEPRRTEDNFSRAAAKPRRATIAFT